MSTRHEGRTFLVTGGAGFVGGGIGTFLKQRHPGSRVLALDNHKRRGSELHLERLGNAGVEFIHGDVRCRSDLRVLPHVDVLIDCSAEPAVLAGYGSGADYMTDTNLVGTLNCLELAARDKSDVVFLSTSRIYPMARLDEAAEELADRFGFGNDLVPGISEKGVSELMPLDGARTLYGATKLASELLLHEFAQMHGLRYVIDRCGVIAGPWQMGRTDQGFVLLWLARHLWKEPLAYIGHGGTGKQVRDVLHIDDLCDLLGLQLDRMDSIRGETFNVGGGPGNAVSLRDCTAMCAELTGHQLEVGAETATRPGDIKAYITDNSKVTSALGWVPRRDVRTILMDSLAWLRQHEQDLYVLMGDHSRKP